MRKEQLREHKKKKNRSAFVLIVLAAPTLVMCSTLHTCKRSHQLAMYIRRRRKQRAAVRALKSRV